MFNSGVDDVFSLFGTYLMDSSQTITEKIFGNFADIGQKSEPICPFLTHYSSQQLAIVLCLTDEALSVHCAIY